MSQPNLSALRAVADHLDNLGLDYAFVDGVHAYVTARDAFKAGGVNGPVPAGSSFRTFPPEGLEDVEIGLKSQFLIGGVEVRANLAASSPLHQQTLH